MESTHPISAAELEPYLGGRTFDDAWEVYNTDGYVIFENVMPKNEVERVRAALAPHLNKTGRNDFEGFKSNRVYGLLAKDPALFSDMATHPLALAFAERELGQSCLLSAMLAINLHPGETVQDWHCDDDQIFVPRPRPTFGVSTFWTIDAMTETNGATELIPGSHLWGEDKRIAFSPALDVKNPDEFSRGHNPKSVESVVKAVMPAGSLMIVKSNLYHRGGANRSDAPRLIVTPQYCTGWARQLENMLLAVPKEIAATLPKRTRELIGYNIHAAFMGYVDGMHPDRALGIED